MILVRLGAAVVTASMLSVPAAGATVPVLGFQGSWNSPAAISRSAAGLASVGVDGVELTENGRHVGTPDSAMRRQLRTAHAHDLPAVLLVSNFSEKIGDFSEPVAHRMLTSAANRKRVARSLVRSVRRQHWDGINVDLESLRPRSAVLRGAASLTVDIAAVAARADQHLYEAACANIQARSCVCLFAIVAQTWTKAPAGGILARQTCLGTLWGAAPIRTCRLGSAPRLSSTKTDT